MDESPSVHNPMSIAQPSTAVGGRDALKAQFDDHFETASTPADYVRLAKTDTTREGCI